MPPAAVTDFLRNRLLSTVHHNELERFIDILELTKFGRGAVHAEPGEPVKTVVFPIDAVFSVVAESAEGDQIEAGIIGNEGAVGIAPFLGAESILLRTMCQIPGTGLIADVGPLIARADGALATAVRRYAVVFMTMASQSAACIRLHPVERRAARWLLMASDRVDRNPFELTQEFWAMMLGVARPSVSVVAGELKRAGLISYTRGQLTILDRPGLEQLTCECYGIITEQYRLSLGTNLRAKTDGAAPTPSQAIFEA
jgi:CRP-like cAMP-binding protein